MNYILLIIALIVAYQLFIRISTFGCKCKKCGKNINCADSVCQYCGEIQNQSSKPSFSSSYSYDSISNDLDGITISLMAKVAKDNGYISNEEANYIEKRFDELSTLTNKNSSVKNIYKQIFELEKESSSSASEIASKLNHLNDDAKRYIFNLLKELAQFDGKFDVLNEISNAMNFHEENKNLSYYEILESNENDDFDTIKKNYRKLAKEYHYDSISSKNLPQDMIDYANEKLKKINEAYEYMKENHKK
jgi:DnaJ like chaperone protein